ncbi:protein masquerade-like [Pollicipes pollicipes]|uniref:protein masquerade-like n=1 Tax=Pollicipes pollicipes TaxID=41117 RepID=UPI0018852703|nr:protein masquerade-like [Pollicipes pollicipes]XP_037087303.1 protein masquerade-like [Pollicipes pollicipes]XP_037087304.1 protein masquerade-like [Pollicipes pollicipes]
MCVHWSLCQVDHVRYEVGVSDSEDFLCGVTDDSELFVCCGRLILNVASAARAEPDRTSTVSQLPLGHLAEAFSLFSPPPEVTTPAPPPSPEAVEAAKTHNHYLHEVLFQERRRREVASALPLGQVIYPSEIARERLKDQNGAPEAAVETTFRSTLGGRLKPASSAGRVKLGGLTPPPAATTGEPDVSRELPIPPRPPPQPQQPQPQPQPLESLAFIAPPPVSPPLATPPPAAAATAPPLAAISVAPRTVPTPINADVRPLKAAIWRGSDAEDGTPDEEAASGRTSAKEAGSGSILSQILDSLPGGPNSRHHEEGLPPRRGQFFAPLPVRRPPTAHQPARPPVGLRPPFPEPDFEPPHLRPGHQDPPHLRPGHQEPPHLRPGHQDPPHLRPGHQEPPHLRPGHQDPPHLRPDHLGSSHQQPPHRDPPHFERPGLDVHHVQQHHSLNHPTVAPLCGRGSELGLHARITTQRGEDGVTGYGEYPWHVGVLAADLSYLCAGVLVAPRMALTVAHCVAQRPVGARLVARVGDWDLAADDELYDAYDVEVVQVIVHPDYYAGNLQNDVALLMLDPPVEGLPHVLPACLPPPHADFTHQHCWVTGWGQARHVSGDVHDPTSYSWLLREAPVAVVPPRSCQQHLRSTHLGPFFQLAARGVLCATGRAGSDACFGDGGGAVVCPLAQDGPDGPLYVAGLVSWGIGCGQDIPAVYTKVSDYYDWIVGHVKDVNTIALFQYARAADAR